MFRCLPSPNLKGPGCVIGGFKFERTMSSRSQVKFLFLEGPEFDLDKSWRVYGCKCMNNQNGNNLLVLIINNDMHIRKFVHVFNESGWLK